MRLLLKLLLCMLIVVTTGLARAEAPNPEPWRVVILMGSDPALPAMQQHDRALRAALQAASPNGVAFFTDTIDAYRFDYREFRPEFLALQRRKYGKQRVDLVIGVGDATIEPIRDLRDDLWPDTPVVFGAIDAAAIAAKRMPADIPAAEWSLDIEGTLALIETMQPEARRLIVIGGSAPFDRDVVSRVMAHAAKRTRWQLEAWDSLSIDQIRQRVRELDATSAVFYTNISRDRAGRSFFPVDALGQFAAASAAPIYGMYGPYMGRGAIAGRVVDFGDAGAQTAALALEKLRRDPTHVGPRLTMTSAASRCTADDQQMARFQIKRSLLPAECALINAPQTLWSQYRGAVLATIAVLALQALTITGLLVQRRRRLQAQADAEQRRLELARAMRFAAMGELTASIAHEINQPLGAILSNADAADMMLRAGPVKTEELRDILADIRRDDLRAHEVIRRLRGLLEQRTVEHEPTHLHPALLDTIALVQPEALRRGVAVEVTLNADNDQMLGDSIQLQQVLLNLTMNAMDAMDEVPAAQRRLSIATADAEQGIELTVSDHGQGIAAGGLDRIFDSFYTTKPDGMGLGLPIVKAIVEAHQGTVTAHSQEGAGTVMTVSLPRRLGLPSPSSNPPDSTSAGRSALST